MYVRVCVTVRVREVREDERGDVPLATIVTVYRWGVRGAAYIEAGRTESNVYDHIHLEIPLLVRSAKSSKCEPSQVAWSVTTRERRVL